jgi:hypothetical protein
MERRGRKDCAHRPPAQYDDVMDIMVHAVSGRLTWHCRICGEWGEPMRREARVKKAAFAHFREHHRSAP